MFFFGLPTLFVEVFTFESSTEEYIFEFVSTSEALVDFVREELR